MVESTPFLPCTQVSQLSLVERGTFDPTLSTALSPPLPDHTFPNSLCDLYETTRADLDSPSSSSLEQHLPPPFLSKMSADLQWLLLRKSNSFIVKRTVEGPIFSSEPGNLRNIHSFKYSGLANLKTVAITPSTETGGLTLSTRIIGANPRHVSTPFRSRRSNKRGREEKAGKLKRKGRSSRVDLVRFVLASSFAPHRSRRPSDPLPSRETPDRGELPRSLPSRLPLRDTDPTSGRECPFLPSPPFVSRLVSFRLDSPIPPTHIPVHSHLHSLLHFRNGSNPVLSQPLSSTLESKQERFPETYGSINRC